MSSSVIARSTARRMRWAMIAPLAALTLLGAAACGSGGGAGSGGAGGGAAETGGADGAHPSSGQMQAFRQCLSEHGVTLASHPQGAGAGTAPGATSGATGATPGATSGATDGSAPAGSGAGRHRDMSTPPPGVTQQAWDSARTACASVAPSPAAVPSTAGS